jgi:coatomer subunit epsilon
MSNNSDPILIDISNAFYTGNYQQCINLAEKIKVKLNNCTMFQLIKNTIDVFIFSQKPSLERDIFMYRSYLATNRYRIVMDEISASSSGDLLAIRLFADFLMNKNKFTDLMEIIEKKIQNSDTELHAIWKIVASIMYVHENQLEEALRILSGSFDLGSVLNVIKYIDP